MKLIVGLGNPAEKYKNNRHNVGAMFIDYMAKLLNGYMVKKTQNYIAIQPSNNVVILLVKPQTFMNQSGVVVKKIIRNLKLEIRNLIVIHDDLDIPLGKFKIQKGVGPKLHNGIQSIEKELATKDFWRVRIGVDNRQPENRLNGETYVLQDFKKEENEILTNQVFPKIFERLKNYFKFLPDHPGSS